MTGVDEASIFGVLVGILTALVTVITLLVRGARDSKEAAYHAQQANHAVNNRGPGEHTMYDMAAAVKRDVAYLVEKQHEFEEKGWNALPADIGTAPALTETIRGLQANDRAISDQIQDLRTLFEEHDRWEREQKYGKESNT